MSTSSAIDEYTGLSKRTMWWLRRVVPAVVIILVVALLIGAFFLKQNNQKGKMDIPPGRAHLYSALH